MRCCEIGPSMLACDLANLKSETEKVIDGGADYVHLDVMDGHFVENITWGPPVIGCLRNHVDIFFDCHMMVEKPSDWVIPIKNAGGNRYTFHYEAVEKETIEDLIKSIQDNGMQVGIALKPNTSIEKVLPFIKMIDMVLIMTVEPGFGGQKFMVNMMGKISTLRLKFENLNIQVDGGLNLETIQYAAKAGANSIVAGSSIFKSNDVKDTISKLRDTVNQSTSSISEFSQSTMNNN